MTYVRSLLLGLALMAAPAAHADPAQFTTGPVIAEYGAVADVPDAERLPRTTHFKVVFDVSEAAEAGHVNSGFDSAARFLNMHARAGVRPENIRLAIVVRGGAVRDLAVHPHPGEDNANAALVAALIAHHVDIYVCGQAAAHAGIARQDLLPGVRLALSAMTIHAQLQQQGYTLNPS